MNIFDDMPDIPPCPHCGHNGEGLSWAFPDKLIIDGVALGVQCACLACGVHAPPRMSYSAAVEAFVAGERETSPDEHQESVS